LLLQATITGVDCVNSKRLDLEERYGDRARYQKLVTVAAIKLAEDGELPSEMSRRWWKGRSRIGMI
jgi:hypothetical protein